MIADANLRIAHLRHLTSFRSAARGLHVPTDLTPEAAQHEARKGRASERPRGGCCEELGRATGAITVAILYVAPGARRNVGFIIARSEGRKVSPA